MITESSSLTYQTDESSSTGAHGRVPHAAQYPRVLRARALVRGTDLNRGLRRDVVVDLQIGVARHEAQAVHRHPTQLDLAAPRLRLAVVREGAALEPRVVVVVVEEEREVERELVEHEVAVAELVGEEILRLEVLVAGDAAEVHVALGARRGTNRARDRGPEHVAVDEPPERTARRLILEVGVAVPLELRAGDQLQVAVEQVPLRLQEPAEAVEVVVERIEVRANARGLLVPRPEVLDTPVEEPVARPLDTEVVLGLDVDRVPQLVVRDRLALGLIPEGLNLDRVPFAHRVGPSRQHVAPAKLLLLRGVADHRTPDGVGVAVVEVAWIVTRSRSVSCESARMPTRHWYHSSVAS